jgi:hypothetical protein
LAAFVRQTSALIPSTERLGENVETAAPIINKGRETHDNKKQDEISPFEMRPKRSWQDFCVLDAQFVFLGCDIPL